MPVAIAAAPVPSSEIVTATFGLLRPACVFPPFDSLRFFSLEFPL